MSHSDYKVTRGVRAKTVVGEGVFSSPSTTLHFFLRPYTHPVDYNRIPNSLKHDWDDFRSYSNGEAKTATERSKHWQSNLPSAVITTPPPTLHYSASANSNVTVKKANKLLGLVHQTVGSSNPGAFSTLYKSLVRPVLECAAPAWNPYLAKDVLVLERVQRRASWLALGQKRSEMEYEDRLRKLKWPRLETRRLFLSLVECYKIVFGMNKLNFDDLFEFTKCNSTRANHPYKLYVKPAKCWSLEIFFSYPNRTGPE